MTETFHQAVCPETHASKAQDGSVDKWTDHTAFSRREFAQISADTHAQLHDCDSVTVREFESESLSSKYPKEIPPYNPGEE